MADLLTCLSVPSKDDPASVSPPISDPCTYCGKRNPAIHRGLHVTELCWCGSVKRGDEWLWRPKGWTLEETRTSHLSQPMADLFPETE